MAWNFLSASLVKRYGLAAVIGYQIRLLRVAVKAALVARSSRQLSIADLKSQRRGDTVFVFGSGYSLTEISPEQWKHIAAHETVGFNNFLRQNWVRVDYHLIRGWGEGANVGFNAPVACRELAALLAANPLYDDTTYVLQKGRYAEVGNTMVAERLLPRVARFFRYRTYYGGRGPSHSFDSGLSHAIGTLCDAVNFAYLMGWRRIVLVGVDLYDSRYFFLPPDRTTTTDYATGKMSDGETSDRGQHWSARHSTAANGAVDFFTEWARIFGEKGVSLEVWNPRSLLAENLPIYRAASTA